MAIIQNDGKRSRRRPALRGLLQMDVSNGVERIRAWPRSRGAAIPQVNIDAREWFRQAQWATKYIDPRLMFQAMAAVKGTPLLPRDILTMMFAGRLINFHMPDGRVIWSEAAMNDVSNSLDTISQLPGAMLVRGETGWTAVPPGAAGQALIVGPDGQPAWGAIGGGGIVAMFFYETATNTLIGYNVASVTPHSGNKFRVLYDAPLATRDMVYIISGKWPDYPNTEVVLGGVSREATDKWDVDGFDAVSATVTGGIYYAEYLWGAIIDPASA